MNAKLWRPLWSRIRRSRSTHPGIALLAIRRYGKDPERLRTELWALGYQCQRCNRLLAAGARCPSHPRLKPPPNVADGWLARAA